MLQRRSGIRFYRPPKAEAGSQRREKGRPGWLGFSRKLFWLWWLWIAVAVVAAELDHGNLAIVCSLVGLFCYLLAPAEHIPRLGLDSRFSVESHEFLDSIVGAT